MLAALFAAAALAMRPPDGTYTYLIDHGARSVVTVSSAASGIVVKEHVRTLLNEAYTTTVYDPITLLQKSYSVESIRSGTRYSAQVAIKAGAFDITLKGQKALKFHPSADSSLPLYLMDTDVNFPAMLPSIESHAALGPFQMMIGTGLPFVVSASNAVASNRPSGVPPQDTGVVLRALNGSSTMWFRPSTLVLDFWQQPDLTIRLLSYDARVADLTPQLDAPALPLNGYADYAAQSIAFSAADGIPLSGTLTLPAHAAKRAPAVVLIHGTGAEDRDETLGPNRPFLQIAHALSNAGYAVLRYDKRGVGKSGGNALTLTRQQLLSDAASAVRYLQSRSDIDSSRIYLIGHSEGGELAPSVAAGRTDIAGIVLLEPPAVRFDELMMQQTTRDVSAASLPPVENTESKVIASIRAGTLQLPGLAWYQSTIDLDPAVDIAKVRSPILIIQGGKDAQVRYQDAQRLVSASKTANNDVTYRFVPDINHFLLPATGDDETDYYRPAYVDSTVLKTIIQWLDLHQPQKPEQAQPAHS